MIKFKKFLLETNNIKLDTMDDQIILSYNNMPLYDLNKETIHIGKMQGGKKIRWRIYSYTKGKDVGNVIAGYTKSSGLAQMKKFAKSAILKMSKTEQLSEMSFAQMKSVEQHADDIFSSLNIDVKLRGHFFDRLNDARNGREITEAEMIHLFNATFKKYGAKIAHMSKGHEAVIFDHMNNINVPFLIDFDNVTGQLVLIPKTVMRKKNFLTRTQKLKV